MQNFTAKFNILYNSNKLLDEAERNRINSSKENYQQELPVFIEPNSSSIKSNQRLMDSIIEKATTVIHEKSESKYIGDAYFLIARANYEKGNYYNAAEFFSYVTKSINPKQSRLMEMALIWKARALMQIGYLNQVPGVLDSAVKYTTDKKHASALYYATLAHYYRLIHQPELAIPSLNRAIAFNHHSQENLRWHYILGQLYAKQGDSQLASFHFNKVIKSNVSYEMSFNAALKQVLTLDLPANRSFTEKMQKLNKMRKDDKNKGYRDQIYYVIGEMYDNEGNDSMAMKNLQLALQEPSTNDFQKTATYFKIADINFRKGHYEEAQVYYDSTATLLKEDFPNYNIIQAKINNLDKLVKQLRIIKEQNTWQRLAKLPETAREAAIDSLINDIKNKKTKSSVLNANKELPTTDGMSNYMTSDRNPRDNDSRFYFNNPAAISSGLSQFKRLWGNRSHGDNWRFGNKATLSTLNKSNHPSDTASVLILTESLTKASLLQQLPLSDSAIIASNQKLVHAYLELGAIYRDDLNDFPNAIITYTTLLKRFPNLEEKDLIYYNLFRLYNNQGNKTQETVYRNLLVNNFPQSRYAKIITDPHYLDRFNKNEQLENDLYSQAYQYYTDENYSEVLTLADRLNHMADPSKKSGVIVQMNYLKALAIGRTQTLGPFENALKELMKNYPQDPLIIPLVKEHLSYIDSNRLSLQKRSVALKGIEAGRTPFVDEPVLTKWPELVFHHEKKQNTAIRQTLAGNLSTSQPAITPFNKITNLQGQVKITAYQQKQRTNSFRDLELFPDSATYFYVIHINNARVNLSPSRYGIGQFNRGQYATSQLTHQLKRIDDELQLLYIGPFFSYEEVKTYEHKIQALLPTIMKIPANNYDTFIITEQYLTRLTDFDQVNDYSVKYHEQF